MPGLAVSFEGIPDVRAEMRAAEFWLERDRAEQPGRSRSQARAAVSGGLIDLDSGSALPRPVLPDDDPPLGYRRSGRPWGRAAWGALAARVHAAHGIPADMAVTVERVSLRRWPTREPAFREPPDREFDQWQVTGVHLMEPVRILAETADGDWAFIVARIAAGWVPARSIARVTPAQWDLLMRLEHPVVAVASGVTTEAAPYDMVVTHKPVEFGAWLLPSDVEHVSGQHRMGHVGVLYPVRDADGWLVLHPALVKDDGRVSRGFLPFTRASVLRAAFTQLGDRYDWGDRLGNHDCSSLVMDAYRTVGVQIPRNSGVQSRSLPHRMRWTDQDDTPARLHDLAAARPGDLLHMSGHVLLYLGSESGTPYALHAFVGYGVCDGGTMRSVLVNAVEVSTLTVPTRSGPSFLQALTGVSHLV